VYCYLFSNSRMHGTVLPRPHMNSWYWKKFLPSSPRISLYPPNPIMEATDPFKTSKPIYQIRWFHRLFHKNIKTVISSICKSCPSSSCCSKHEQVQGKLPDTRHLKFCLGYKKQYETRVEFPGPSEGDSAMG